MDNVFKVISEEKKVDTGRQEEIIAIDFRKPTMIKFFTGDKFKKGDKLSLQNDSVVFDGKIIGKVLKTVSADQVKADHSYDIKYTGGYSLDGKEIYLDEHFPEFLEVETKKISSIESIGYHHELPEKWLSDEKYEYPYAHEVATGIEKEYVESLGVTWKGYCKEVDKNLRKVYANTLKKSPISLDLAPYLYCRDREALNEIRKSTSD
jgi:hypothetical protein